MKLKKIALPTEMVCPKGHKNRRDGTSGSPKGMHPTITKPHEHMEFCTTCGILFCYGNNVQSRLLNKSEWKFIRRPRVLAYVNSRLDKWGLKPIRTPQSKKARRAK